MISKDGALYLGHLGPIPLYVHWTFIFLIWMVMSGGAPGGIDSLTYYLTVMSVLLIGIVLHELGHGLAARSLGEMGITITLWAFGGVCSSTRSGRPWRELIIVLAGPLVSAILWLSSDLALKILEVHGSQWLSDDQGAPSILTLFLFFSASINKMLLIFNMLPIFPFDGGQAVHNVLLMFLRRHLANQITLAVAVVGAIAYVAYRQQQSGHFDLFLVLLMFFMLQNAFQYLRR